ncbi:hypothetical protein D9756_006642 [Leucocoprinus leucothites]|uniref:GRIP domain-containing protein n=1 Tax=Leucocoprinus leucothites TaxID=201217 RepID=A0A8H5LHE7_9AGAR|nr:hypothetical protein D9756_006642 [Leucoagaricus leucothites]
MSDSPPPSSEPSPSSPTPNGHTDQNEEPQTIIQKLRDELEKAREEKESLASQHQTLLSKVSNIRNTLGAKLKQDAEELDRQGQLIDQLTSERDDLSSTLTLLQTELETSHSELESTTSKYDALRSRMQVSAQESMHRERELRDLQNQLEQTRLDRDEWKRSCEKEKAVAEEVRVEYEEVRRTLEMLRGEEEGVVGELEREREKARNLQAVLQDFQAAKDHELRQAVKDYESQLTQVTQSLAEFKSRALNAELQLEETQSTTSRALQLEKELKEKNLLIGKLRHEAVIMNEHLIEALRRLRRSSTETKSSVDGRLVTNILLQFLTTPRADSKRFEMLALLGTILSWNEEEREKAGLLRAGSHTLLHQKSTGWGGGGGKSPELERTDETESFSRLWVEFLLKEANAGDGAQQLPLTPSTTASSLPGSPTLGPSNLRAPQTRRLASIGSAASAAVASAPDLVNGKGKERMRE